MTQTLRAFVTTAACLVVWSTAVFADPPQISGIQPFGIQRSKPTEVTVAGTSLAGRPRLIAPFAFKLTPTAKPGTDAAKWTFSLDVAPETPIGVYVVRVQTDDGLSNPFLFAVGQVAQVAEVEDNNRFEIAQAVPSPCIVEGQTAGNDVDNFKFPGKKGQMIVVDAQCARIGSGVDPTLRLMTASRQFVASADDTAGLLTDARLTAVLPADGDYVVELSDTRYQGGGRPIYRLLIGELPVADEVYPLGGRRGETVGFELRGGTIGEVKLGVARIDAPKQTELIHPRFTGAMLGLTTPLDVESVPSIAVDDYPEVREPADPAAPPVRVASPVVLNGRIESKGDEDVFVIAVTPGQKLRFDVSASDLGSALDGVLQIRGANNAVLATADDTTTPVAGKMKNKKAPAVISPDPSVEFTVPSNLTEISVALRDLKGEGGIGYGYRLTVEPVIPSFDLALNDAQISIPKGGTVGIGAVVTRKGYTGPITLDVVSPPPGLTVRTGLVGDGQTAGYLTVTAAPDAAFDRIDLDVVGRFPAATGPSIVPASKLQVFALQGTMPTNVLTTVGLPAAIALAAPLGLEVPSTPVEVVHGFGGNVPVKVIRPKGAEGALAIALAPPAAPLPAPPPPAIAVAATTIAEKATEGSPAVTIPVEIPLGPTTIVLTAKGKIGGKDRTFTFPAVTLNIVRPAAIELAAPAAEIKPGATVEIKGKLVRKAPCKEPVTIKLEGLPAGLKADPVIVAPDKADFVLKLVADAKAPVAAAAVAARLTVAFQINKKDYPTPPTPLPVKVIAAK
jgi:hypothetical protein